MYRAWLLACGLAMLTVASPARSQDLDFRLVAVTTPTGPETVTTLPGSITEVCDGDTFYIELWVSDVTGTPPTSNTGVSSAYVDLVWPGAQAMAVWIDHGTIYDTLPSGTIGTGQIDELGGSVLSSNGVGIEPEWARAAVVESMAGAVGDMTYSLQPSVTGVAALGRGHIPWDGVQLNVVVLPRPSLGDLNGDLFVNGNDIQIFVDALLSGSTDPWLLCHADFNGDGLIDLDDAGSMVATLLGCSHDGDLNGDLSANGNDIQVFVDALLSNSTDPWLRCHADFNGDGLIDPDDIGGMVAELLD